MAEKSSTEVLAEEQEKWFEEYMKVMHGPDIPKTFDLMDLKFAFRNGWACGETVKK